MGLESKWVESKLSTRTPRNIDRRTPTVVGSRIDRRPYLNEEPVSRGPIFMIDFWRDILKLPRPKPSSSRGVVAMTTFTGLHIGLHATLADRARWGHSFLALSKSDSGTWCDSVGHELDTLVTRTKDSGCFRELSRTSRRKPHRPEASADWLGLLTKPHVVISNRVPPSTPSVIVTSHP